MDGLTFTSNAIDSLAWPVVVLLLVIILRDEIAKVVPLLKRLKAGPIEAEFERQVQELKEAVAVPIGEQAADAPDTASKAFLYQLSDLHPRSAILESWVRLEAAARAVLNAKRPDQRGRGYIPAAKLGRALVHAEVISSEQESLFHKLRHLRNDIAHEQTIEPDAESANAYVDLASFLQGWLEGQLR